MVDTSVFIAKSRPITINPARNATHVSTEAKTLWLTNPLVIFSRIVEIPATPPETRWNWNRNIEVPAETVMVPIITRRKFFSVFIKAFLLKPDFLRSSMENLPKKMYFSALRRTISDRFGEKERNC